MIKNVLMGAFVCMLFIALFVIAASYISEMVFKANIDTYNCICEQEMNDS